MMFYRLRGIPKYARSVFVIAETTPNPESIMFYPKGKDVLGVNAKAKSYIEKHSSSESPLATALFKIHGVNQILLGQKHITVTKKPSASWDHLQPNVELVVSQFFASDLEPIHPKLIEYYAPTVSKGEVHEDESIDQQIEELLMTRVQPFVQQDGGDIEFVEYTDNIVFIRMQGACSGCPKSSITLNFQIKNLVQHFFPQVLDVIAVDEMEEEIPRPH